MRARRRVRDVLCRELTHLAAEATQQLALVHEHLATEQVERLNAGGALVEGADARIAVDPLHAVLFDVAVATKHLDAVAGGLQTNLGDETLADGGEKSEVVLDLVLFGLARALGEPVVAHHGRVVDDRTRGFAEGTLGEQHATHVRMHDERVGHLLRILGTTEGAHREALTSIPNSALVAELTGGQTLQAGAQTCRVHEGEHLLKAVVRLTDQIADRVLKVHDTGGRRLDAHLVLDAATGHVSFLLQSAVLLLEMLRNQEQ
mmetsp:Transcript_11540/g.29099  ORF Transcript_11540/g.29099 Transcript_11540/m.29099 type:complete len:261 (+) Transcript_11540:375-1157(+)